MYYQCYCRYCFLLRILFFCSKYSEGLGELTPQQAKPARYAANLAEIEQVPFCAVIRPRLRELCRIRHNYSTQVDHPRYI